MKVTQGFYVILGYWSWVSCVAVNNVRGMSLAGSTLFGLEDREASTNKAPGGAFVCFKPRANENGPFLSLQFFSDYFIHL